MVASFWYHNRLMVFSKSWCLFSLLGSCTSFQHGNCVTFIWFFSIFFLSVSLFSVCLAEEDVSRIETSDDGFEELKLSEEVQQFIAGISTELSAEGEKELMRYEEAGRAFLKRKNAIKEKAKPGPTIGVLSLTPKVNPHKARVKRVSRFQSSPYDSSLTVTPDQEEVYRKILLSNSRHRDDSSELKR